MYRDRYRVRLGVTVCVCVILYVCTNKYYPERCTISHHVSKVLPKLKGNVRDLGDTPEAVQIWDLLVNDVIMDAVLN